LRGTSFGPLTGRLRQVQGRGIVFLASVAYR